MKLNYKRTFFVGLAFLSISSFWQMYDNIIPLILQNTFHLNDVLIGAIMALDNVLAVFLLPCIWYLIKLKPMTDIVQHTSRKKVSFKDMPFGKLFSNPYFIAYLIFAGNIDTAQKPDVVDGKARNGFHIYKL